MNTTQINLKVKIEQRNSLTIEAIKDEMSNHLDFEEEWLKQAEMHLHQCNMCVTRALFEKVPTGKK